MSTSVPRKPNLDALSFAEHDLFSYLVNLAKSNDACPLDRELRAEGFVPTQLRSLALHGAILITSYNEGRRQIEILTGPEQGKKTQAVSSEFQLHKVTGPRKPPSRKKTKPTDSGVPDWDKLKVDRS